MTGMVHRYLRKPHTAGQVPVSVSASVGTPKLHGECSGEQKEENEVGGLSHTPLPTSGESQPKATANIATSSSKGAQPRNTRLRETKHARGMNESYNVESFGKWYTCNGSSPTSPVRLKSLSVKEANRAQPSKERSNS